MEKKISKNSVIIMAIIAMVVIGLISFFVGYRFGGLKNGVGGRGNFNNFDGQARMMPGAGAGRIAGQMAQGGRMNFIDGEVISKTDQNLTMKLTDGGSKIILLGSSTTVSKSTSGSIDDLVPGTKLMISGDTNTDGSVTARTIQLKDSNMVAPIPSVDVR